MRIFIATIIICLTFYIIKVDLFEGTIPLAYSQNTQESCLEAPQYITVEILPGDTIYSVFALYPSEHFESFTERLDTFYKLNPHLMNQTFNAGEKVLLPLNSEKSLCK